MAASQNRKIKCLKKNKIKIPEYLASTPIDFNNQSLESVLTSAGYQKDKRTLFLWEGVSMYLETLSIKDTLTFIQQYSPPDSLLAFDYVVSFQDEDIHQYYGAKEMLKTSPMGNARHHQLKESIHGRSFGLQHCGRRPRRGTGSARYLRSPPKASCPEKTMPPARLIPWRNPITTKVC